MRVYFKQDPKHMTWLMFSMLNSFKSNYGTVGAGIVLLAENKLSKLMVTREILNHHS